MLEFHYQTYLEDTKTLSGESKGIIFELFLNLAQIEGRMEIKATAEEFARLLRCSPEEFLRSIRNIADKDIFTIEDVGPSTANGKPLIIVTICNHNKAYAW